MSDEQPQNNLVEELDLNEILRIRRQKLADLQQSGQDPFCVNAFIRTHLSDEIIHEFETLEGKQVAIAGRMMSRRIMGKASFAHVQDKQGLIQVYMKVDTLGEVYDAFKSWDIGDIIGVTGEVFRTHKGEISVKAENIILLSKSLQPLPEKWHGLKDTDLRYRQRYVDLIVNPDVKRVFEIRSKIIGTMRRLLDERGFIEVETPILNNIPGGAAAKPFVTHHNTLDMDMYLRIAPELYLKRLIVGGLEKVYEIGRLFRNEGMSVKHNPEFTAMELYEAYTDYHGMMKMTEYLISGIAQEVLGSTTIQYQEVDINLTPPFARMTMTESVLQYTGVDFNQIKTFKQALDSAQSVGVHADEKMTTMGEVLNLLFEEKVEAHLVQPTFILDYPIEVSPLTKRRQDNSHLTERFELFIGGREYGNAYTELNDPLDQKERLLRQASLRNAGDEEANMMDDDFIHALEYGMPPTGGLGIGIDRLVMLLTDSASIRDVLLFPTMKPKA